MSINLFDDIRDDPGFVKSLLRIALFILLLLFLDFGVSVFLEKGMNRFYGLDGKADLLMIGHSHLMLAVDKPMLEEQTGMLVAKYTREGVNVSDRYIMLKQYFSNGKQKSRLVVYSIDPWLFTGKGLSANSYKLFYPFMDNPDVDAYVHLHAADRFDYLSHRYFRSYRFNTTLVNAALRGYLGNWSNLKIGRLDTLQLKKEIESGNYRHVSFDEENIDTFRKTLPLLSAHAERVILLNTPVSGILARAVRQDYDRSMQMIRDMAAPYPNIHVVDLSPDFEDREELFFDPIHMNPDGQQQVTAAFSSVAESLLVR